MGLSLGTGVPVITVFLQGLLSFFSPCVLPLVPLYISYLAGGARTVDENGRVIYPRSRVMVNTLFFVLGISFTFFVLGFGFSALGRFFSSHRVMFARVSGIIMALFGLYQLGALGHSGTIEKEHRLPFNLSRFTMNPLVALVLGFTFSFAWTPCVGPALGSVLLMVSSAGQKIQGFWLIGVYTVGFVIPFLAVGIFTGTVLDFFKTHQGVVRYTVKIGGILLILMGVMTFTGYMNGITSYLSSFGGGGTSKTAPQTPGGGGNAAAAETAADQADADIIPAPDFTLTDQYGDTHTLSDYKGKTVFLNFWATWCPPCQQEMPEIQALYERYGSNKGDLVVLGVANPKTAEHLNNNDSTQPEVEQFLKDKGYTFPVVMDTTGDVFSQYAIQSFPTTFMIDKGGNIFGHVSGALSADTMESIVNQTMAHQTPGGGEKAAAAVTESGGETQAAGAGETGAAAGTSGETAAETAADQTDADITPAPDFTLTDQYGNTHTLSDYKGKTVFLNFWATWCPPCKHEMPEIQALYERYGSNKGDLVVLGVANPKTAEHLNNNDSTQPEVEKFLKDKGYTFPVVMDTTGDVFSQYLIQSFPTTFMIDKDGNIFGQVSGALSADMMESIVNQTMTGVLQ